LRFDTTAGEPAWKLLERLDAVELANLIFRYGEERHSRRIARRIARLIVSHRPLTTTTELADLIENEMGRPRGRAGTKHPATKIFQALRIAVNDELGEIERGLAAAVELLGPGGRLAVISFHSLEDRLAKQFFRALSRDCICPPEQPVCTCQAQATMKPVTRKAVKAGDEEIARNPRSRSARLRVAARVGETG
jgi:16S rRNA (cytosine1402-N4)-methyltransferase